MLNLVRPAAPAVGAWEPDGSQRAVLDDRSAVLRVFGGPGTGKSATAAGIVATRVAAGELTPDQCLVLAPTRRAAARLRDLVTEQVAGTHRGPLARTPHSFAFGVLRRRAALRDEPPPRLISGPEQDVILRDLLEGYAAQSGLGPVWPAAVGQAVGTRTFRGELRDLLMRAVELGVGSEDLRTLGERLGRREWVAAAHVLDDYDQVTALASPGALDPAWLLGSVATALESDPELVEALRAEIRLVVVDDAQDLTPAAADLLGVLAGHDGVDLVLLGDPDSATQTFRGAEPDLMVTGWPGATVLVLERSYRVPIQVAAAARRVVGHVGTVAGVAQRNWSPTESEGSARSMIFRTPAQEAGWVADHLRRRHLLDAVPWSRMAVIVRGASSAATAERVLRAAAVPVTSAASGPVREHPAVRPFLTIARVVLADPRDPQFSPDDATDLMTSPLGGLDSVALRRIRRALRRRELADGGGRPSSELLAAALVDPGAGAALAADGAAVRRVQRVVAAASTALAEGGDVEALLWAMWSAAGLAETWQRSALAGGGAGRRADDALDAVLALFEAAARYAERMPGSAPAAFVDHVLAQDLAADTLAPRGLPGEAVALLTPAEAAGREWDIVCVLGVQEGVWPDPRLRGSLLGAADLVEVARGRSPDRVAARTAVIHDETRLLHVAVTRTRRELVVSAVRSEDQQPSPYLDVVDPRPDTGVERAAVALRRPLSLPGLVGDLRRAVVAEDPRLRGPAASLLRRLAAQGVPGADPVQWWPLVTVSCDRPRRAPDQLVRLSPSTLDRFGKCQLQWFFSSIGGQGPALGASQVGTLVHDIAHDLGDTTASAYAAELRARWPRLGLPDNWLARKTFAEAVAMTGRLAGHVAEADEAGWRRVASEVEVDVVVGRARIRGRVDRVEQAVDGTVRIIDLKTGSSKPTKDEVARHRQLGAYQLAVDGGALGVGVRSGGAGLLQLGKAAKGSDNLQAQTPLAQDPEPEWAARAIAEDAEAMAGAVFLARPTRSLCGTCQVKSSCPAFAEGRFLA